MLAFRLLSELSMLDEEFDSERLEVWFVEMLALRLLSELSMLDEEFESERLEV
jgi:hypothetical protein